MHSNKVLTVNNHNFLCKRTFIRTRKKWGRFSRSVTCTKTLSRYLNQITRLDIYITSYLYLYDDNSTKCMSVNLVHMKLPLSHISLVRYHSYKFILIYQNNCWCSFCNNFECQQTFTLLLYDDLRIVNSIYMRIYSENEDRKTWSKWPSEYVSCVSFIFVACRNNRIILCPEFSGMLKFIVIIKPQ